MNPLLMSVLAEAEQKGLTLLLDEIAVVVKDVIAGKSVVDAFTDAAETLAEKEATAIRDVLSPE